MADDINPIEADVQRMLAPAQERVAALGTAIRGAGEDAFRAYEDFRMTVSSIPQVGADAVERVVKVRADDSLPADHRQRVTAETLATAETITDKFHQLALQKLSRLESSLASALVPLPGKDWAERSARRGELDALLAGNPTTMVVRAIDVLRSGNAAHQAEILTEYGNIKLKLAGLDPAQMKQFQGAATGILAQQVGGTPKQQNARIGLNALRESNVMGFVSAFTMSSQLRTGAFKPLPPRSIVNMPPASSVAPALPPKKGGRMKQR